MHDRFTHKSRVGRGKIPQHIRDGVYRRDDYTCQFCGRKLQPGEVTIDHLVPIALGGLDEKTNYVTACQACNGRKGCVPLHEFAKTLDIAIDVLPVHGDPIIDNIDLPLEIRMIRKRIFDKGRVGEIRLTGKQAQKKIEKEFRRALWQSKPGKALESEMPNLPGQARASVIEIDTIASTPQERLLLIELAKSANTRNLIGSVLTKGSDICGLVVKLASRKTDPALSKRLQQAIRRFRGQLRQNDLEEPEILHGVSIGAKSDE